MIAARGLSVYFGRTVALDGVDLDVGEGVTGIFGPNGSGKSALLRVVSGLQRPSRGSIAFRGAPIRLADEAWRRRVGYAGHLGGLYDNLTLAENLDLCARLYGVDRAAALAALARLGLREHARRPAGSLSAGLRRRAAVARALVHDPAVLLLDEPYANLDEDAVALVSEALRAWRRPGRVALVATHGAKELKRWADAGVVLKRGRVAVAGRYDRSPRPRPARA